MKRLLILVAAVVAGSLYLNGPQGTSVIRARAPVSEKRTATSDSVIADAFANHKSNLQVSGEGTVTRSLPDDNKGSRHQKFIIALASGQTLLVAHNVDIAPRIGSLRQGDSIQFSGEYEWNPKGGVVHWTHRDPAGAHAAGWLKHQGRTYQ